MAVVALCSLGYSFDEYSCFKPVLVVNRSGLSLSLFFRLSFLYFLFDSNKDRVGTLPKFLCRHQILIF
jgi:hypothetical protein